MDASGAGLGHSLANITLDTRLDPNLNTHIARHLRARAPRPSRAPSHPRHVPPRHRPKNPGTRRRQSVDETRNQPAPSTSTIARSPPSPLSRLSRRRGHQRLVEPPRRGSRQRQVPVHAPALGSPRRRGATRGRRRRRRAIPVAPPPAPSRGRPARRPRRRLGAREEHVRVARGRAPRGRRRRRRPGPLPRRSVPEILASFGVESRRLRRGGRIVVVVRATGAPVLLGPRATARRTFERRSHQGGEIPQSPASARVRLRLLPRRVRVRLGSPPPRVFRFIRLSKPSQPRHLAPRQLCRRGRVPQVGREGVVGRFEPNHARRGFALGVQPGLPPGLANDGVALEPEGAPTTVHW